MITKIETPMEVTKPIGTLFPKGAVLRFEDTGFAKDELVDWALGLSLGSRAPTIYCRKTQRYYMLSWQEICELAQAAGLGKDGS
jgi:hypothetical protein